MDQFCHKVLLVLIHHCIQTLLFSIPPISFFSIKMSISIVFFWSGLLVSKNFNKRSPRRNRNPHKPELAERRLVQTYIETPIQFSRKLQLYILVSSSALTLSYNSWVIRLKRCYFFMRYDTRNRLFEIWYFSAAFARWNREIVSKGRKSKAVHSTTLKNSNDVVDFEMKIFDSCE